MKVLRCFALLSICLLSACDQSAPPDKPAVVTQAMTAPVVLPKVPEALARQPKPDLQAPAVGAPAPSSVAPAPAPPASAAEISTQARPVDFAPSVKPVLVTASGSASVHKAPPKVAVKTTAHGPAKATPETAKTRARANSEVIAAPLPKAALDLNLPTELVRKVEPKGKVEPLKNDAVLPPMFVDKSHPSPFQLNGKLLTNDTSRDNRNNVDGAAVEFEFKQ